MAKIDRSDERERLGDPPPEPAMTAPVDEVTVTLPDGKNYRLSVAAGADAYHDAVVAGGVSDDTWQFLNDWVQAGDTFFDLGANIGTISLPAAVHGATVHAFELLAENLVHLTKSLRLNDIATVSVILGAVADKPGFAAIGGFSAWGTVLLNGSVLIPHIVIDDYVAARNVRQVDFMKIDVEGSEWAALKGAQYVIERDWPDILIECNIVTCGNHGYSYRELLRFLETRGYELYRVDRRRLCPWSSAMPQEVVFADYFATVRTPEFISDRCGWPIVQLDTAGVIENFVREDLYNDLHKQHLLAVIGELPDAVRADPRVGAIVARLEPTRDDAVIALMQAGAAAVK